MLLDHVRRLRQVPGDIFAIFVVVVTFDLLVAIAPIGAPLRTLLGLVLVTFVPGYLLVAILDPTAIEADANDAGRGTLVRDDFERIALSIGCSLLVSPLAAVGMEAIGISIASETAMIVVNTGILVALAVAAVRRLRVQTDRRYSITGHRRPLAELRSTVRNPTLPGVVNVVLILTVVLAASTMTFALVAPQDGEHTTTLSVLGQNDSGEFVAGSYPRTLSTDTEQTVVLSVTNHEGTTTTYTVVAELQRVGDDGQTVTAESELDRFEASVDAGERWRAQHTIEPTITGQRLRVVYTLYRGDAPADARRSSAYRSVYFWVSVSSAQL